KKAAPKKRPLLKQISFGAYLGVAVVSAELPFLLFLAFLAFLVLLVLVVLVVPSGDGCAAGAVWAKAKLPVSNIANTNVASCFMHFSCIKGSFRFSYSNPLRGE